MHEFCHLHPCNYLNNTNDVVGFDKVADVTGDGKVDNSDLNKFRFYLGGITSIDGYVCIVNDTQTDIIRDEEWYQCHTKLIHISELKGILEEWVQGKDNTA